MDKLKIDTPLFSMTAATKQDCAILKCVCLILDIMIGAILCFVAFLLKFNEIKKTKLTISLETTHVEKKTLTY